MPFIRRRLVVATIALLFATTAARAQTRTWTGSATPDNNWGTLYNWNIAVPVSGNTAVFDASGSSRPNVSLGGTTRPIGGVLFDTNSSVYAPYVLGELGSGDKFSFDPNGTITSTNSVQLAEETINAEVLTNGSLSVANNSSQPLSLKGNVTIGGAGTLTVSDNQFGSTVNLDGNITETLGQSASLVLQLSSGTVALRGTNAYTGPTTIQDNVSNSTVVVGSDSVFGTGPVTVNLAPGSTALSLATSGGGHTIPNALKLNSGLTFYPGPNNFLLSGPITIINSAAGGTRTLTSGGDGSTTFGASPGSSTITLGNPVANGGDGIGKTLNIAPFVTTFTVNDVLQDPAPGGGTASGSVQYSGSIDGVVKLNSLNTYTGTTSLNGGSSIQFNHDFNAGDPSGPFGRGTIIANNAPNNVLQPVGGNRTIANPISMVFGLTVANAGTDTSSLTLTGPITMSNTGRTITNNFGTFAGTLTLGSAANPSTLTLPTQTGQALTITGAGSTVINDVIQNASPPQNPAPGVVLTGNGRVDFNSLSTYTGDTTLNGAGTIIRIGANSNGLPGPSFTAGPFGTGTIIPNNSSTQPIFAPLGADRTVANPINMTFGFVVTNLIANDDPQPHNLTFTGPITLGATGRIITNNMSSAAALTLGSATNPSTITLGSTLTLQSLNDGSGVTIINDAVTGSGGITVQTNTVVQLNGTSNYSGATSVSGTIAPKLLINGTKSGTGTVTIGAAGTLGGTGSVAGAITNNGTIAPGNSVGTLTAVGNVTMGTSSHLAIELSGGSADKLVVGGNLNLSNVESLDVSGPGAGLSWVIATYGSLTGFFDHIPAGYTVSYGTGTNSQITLNAVPSGLKGDFNNDGKVDAGDYVSWRKNNSTSNAFPNDNGLGTPIGPSHFTLWRNNYGKPPGSASDTLDGATVPEPATLLLAYVATAGLCSVRRRD